MFKIVKSIETESRLSCQGLGVGRMGSDRLMGTGFSCEKVLELEVLVSRHCECTKYTELYALS